MNEINQSYFENNKSDGRKLKFIQLLKHKCGVKARHATVLWDNLCENSQNSKPQQLMNYKQEYDDFDNFYLYMIQTQCELTTALQKKDDEIEQLKKIIALLITQNTLQIEQTEAYDSSACESEPEIECSPSVAVISRSSCSMFDTDIDEYASSDHTDMDYQVEIYNKSPENQHDTAIYSNNTNMMEDCVHFVVEHGSHKLANESDTMLDNMEKIVQRLPSTGKVITCPSDDKSSSTTSKTKTNNNQRSQKQNNNNHDKNNTYVVSLSNGSSGGGDDNGDDKRNRKNGNHNRNDDDDEKEEEKEEQEEEDDDDDEQDDEKLELCEHSKILEFETTKLNPNAKEWSTKKQKGSTLSTIDETKGDVIKKATLMSKDPTGPGKVKISTRLTEQTIQQQIIEKIPYMYDYMNKSLLLRNIKIIFNGYVGVINYGFHHKISKEPLYCVMIKVANESKNKKYDWKMEDQLFTNIQIEKRFNITTDKLPLSASYNKQFLMRIFVPCQTIQNIVLKSKWHNIKVHSKKNNKERKILSLSSTEFKNKIKKYNNLQNANNLVPIVRINKNQYWVEHLWIVQIEDNAKIAVALQYNAIKNKIEVKGIHLNKEFIIKSHQLIPFHNCHCLDNFASFYDDLQIGDINEQKNKNKQLKKELKRCKSHIQKLTSDLKAKEALTDLSQLSIKPIDDHKQSVSIPTPTVITPTPKSIPEQIETILTNVMPDCISNIPYVPLKRKDLPCQPLQRINETVYYDASKRKDLPIIVPCTRPMSIQPIPINTICIPNASTSFIFPLPSLPNTNNLCYQISGKSGVSSPTTTATPSSIYIPTTCTFNNCKTSQPFVTAKPKKLIFIDKYLTKSCLTLIEENFNDNSKQLFYYLNHTISMQINDRFAKIYDNDLIIINPDLRSKASKTNLYAIIEPNDVASFAWKMVNLCDATTICGKYNVNVCDLPISSRNKISFQRQLSQHQKTKPNVTVINDTDFCSLKLIKNKGRTSAIAAKREISIHASEIKESVTKAIQNQMPTIPIVKIKGDQYWIESVMICKIPQNNINANFGVSFRCNDGRFEATSIFLDKTEIENQHKLTGEEMQYNMLNQFVSGFTKMIIL